MSRSRTQLEEWLKTIDVKCDTVVGIGDAQKLTKGRTKSWEVNDYIIIDLVQPHETEKDVQVDTTWDIQEEFKCPNGGIELWEKHPVDIIFCTEVSEYWHNPVGALQNINKMLKQGGTLYISFHTLYGLHKPEGLVYLNYTRYGIEKLLKETGFEIEEIIPKTISEDSRGYLKQFYDEEGMKILWNDVTFKEGYLIKAKKI
jgi:SAM-dependent methyltransferase